MSQLTNLKRPSLWLYFTEGFRAIAERLKLKSFFKNYQGAEGDGHPVLVIPGFMTTDRTTKELRKFLNKIGYSAYGWERGRNLAKLEDLDQLNAKIDSLYQQYNQPVTLIGWSLGGVYARQLAKRKPERIRQLITLGSPFAALTAPNNATWIYRIIHGRQDDAVLLNHEWLTDLDDPAPVPTTCVFSKKDGIVPWQACREKIEDELHQNVEVDGSHVGLGVNKDVIAIIAERLPYSRKNWVKHDSISTSPRQDYIKN